MGEFFVYILKSSVCLAVLYLFYRLFLSRETFYNFNRIAILGILVLSLLLPLCEVTIKQQTEVQQTVLTLEQILLLADSFAVEEDAGLPAQEVRIAWWIRGVLLIYLGGVIFFLFRNVYSMVRLMKLIRSSVRLKLQKGIWLATHSNPAYSPFSWMNFIVLSHNDANNTEILIHETAHIRKRHSLDLLVTDICIIFQWFNPAAWLFRQELQNIHEYQADEAVLGHGVNAKQYQLLLIKKAAGTRLYSMANSFNHSKLKKRITMMLKRKSNPWARLKYLYVLPVAAIAVTAFARPEISKELKEISAVKVNDLTAIVETKEVEKEAPDNEKTVLLPDLQEKQVSSPVPVPVRRIAMEPDATKNNQVERVVVEIKAPVIRTDTIINEPLILVDGEEVSNTILKAIDSNKIESIAVLRDESATDVYGEKGANGVILITLKDNPGGNVVNKTSVKLRGKMSDVSSGTDSMEYYIDDVRVDRDQFSNLSSDDLKGLMVKKSPDKESVWIVSKTKNGDGDEDKIEVRGTVKDEEGNPVIGATIIVAGSNQGTITDLDGSFIFHVSPDSEIMVSYIGMQSVRVKSQKEVNVVMKSE